MSARASMARAPAGNPAGASGMDRLYFFTKAPLDRGQDLSFQELLRRSGANTGNFFFMRAVERHLKFDTIQRGHLTRPNKAGAENDAIVIPAANWLSAENRFLGRVADRIEKSGLPCIVIGLGAQAPSDAEKIELSAESKRFLKVVSERSHSIGVRGNYTAEIVASTGVHNVSVIGCPSYFWSLSRRLTLRKPRRQQFAISVNASRNRRVADEINDDKLRVERDLYLEASRRYGSFVTVQTEQTEGKLAFGEELMPDDCPDKGRLLEFLGNGLDIEAHRDRFRAYQDIESWLQDLAEVDLVIGTRLHACLLGLAAAIPSILITIDSRTSEIAQLLGLPHYPADSPRLYLGLEDLYRSTDFSVMLRRYPELFDNYRRFLTDNGLATHLQPASLVDRLRQKLAAGR